MPSPRHLNDAWDDEPSLRDRFSEDEEILPLFSEDADDVKIAVRRLVARLRRDPGLEDQLVDALLQSLDDECDDSQATVWILVVLAEARSTEGIDLILRSLLHQDEMIQDAAGMALLRIGVPAIARLMEWVDEDHGHAFNRQAYRILGETGILRDELLHRRIVQFLEERWPIEREQARDPSAIAELAVAFGRLGHRPQLPQLKEVLARVYRGRHFAIEDAIACLEANEDGVPFVPTIAPWEERYGWILSDGAEDDSPEDETPLAPSPFFPPEE